MKPTATSNAGRAFVAIVALLMCCVWTPAAFAQRAPGVGSNDVVRYSRTFAQVAGRQGVSVWLHRQPDASGWQLRLVDRTAQRTVGISKLPEWIGAEYYQYDVDVRGFGNAIVLIFEAAPTPGVKAPPAAESHQVAWAYGVRRGERKPIWVEVASTRNSPVDGGDRLAIRRINKKEQLVRLRTSDEARFCGENLIAYQEFNPAEISFRSRVDLRTLSDAATALTSRIPEDDIQDLRFPRFALWYSATSDRYNSDDSRTVIRPLPLGDGNLDTAWTEGANGMGRGEFVTARVNDTLKMRGLRIAAGHFGSPEDYAAHGRPKRILISLEDGTRFSTEIPDTSFDAAKERGGHVIWFPRPVRSSCISVVLLDAIPGEQALEPVNEWKRTAVAISELAPVSELEGLAPEVAALVVVEKLLKETDFRRSRRLVQLTMPLATHLVAVLNSVLETGSDEDRVRVVPLLRNLPSEESVPVLVQMFEDARTTDRAYMMIKPAIAVHRERAASELAEILRERPPKSDRKYTDLTRLIGRLGGPEHLNLLLEYLGEGTTRVRHERVRAVSAGGEKMLVPLFSIAEESVDEPRGEDALLGLVSIGRKLHYRGQGVHEGSEALMKVANSAELRRTMLLTLRALGYFQTEGAVALLADFAANSPDPLLRKQAIDGIARYEGTQAREVLDTALRDGSPDVRIAAADGIALRADRRDSIPALRSYVTRETWSIGLEVAFGILAELGDDALIDDIAQVIVTDPSTSRAAAAADALMRHERSIGVDVIEKLLTERSTSLVMRRNLLDLLGLADDDRAEKALGRVIDTAEPFRDLDSRNNERLRHRAILALGRRDSADGRERLVRIAADASADADLRGVALRALAFSRQRELVPRLQTLAEDAPAELKEAFDQTVDIIERRASIQELEEGIEAAEQKAKTRAEKHDELQKKQESEPDDNKADGDSQ